MKKVFTLILDGFGYREETKGNAIWAANPNNFKAFFQKYPHAFLEASGKPIGLDENQFGNSEIGHMTIGAGRIVKSPKKLADEYLSTNEFDEQIKDIDHNKRIHIMGLLSDGCVHSDINHFKTVFNKLTDAGFKNIFFHLITDGRDTGKKDFLNYYHEVNNWIKEKECGIVSTICGRYYAMDRDQKWDRTNYYYNLITGGIGYRTNNVDEIINAFYNQDVTDEFLKPIIINKDGLIKNGDVLFWMNYRTDRAKQIIGSLVNKNFNQFEHYDYPDLSVYTLVRIDKNIKTNVLNEKATIVNPLGRYLSDLGLTQARIAETEKYAHVTYFFDGEYDGAIEGCDKFLIPSPKVATYDLKPEMSIVDVTKKVIAAMDNDYDFILCNFANPDMVGHTGNYEATVKAIMAVDICLGKLIEKAEENFYTIFLLADHGNADTMIDEAGNPVTTHSMEKVPFVINDPKIRLKPRGTLADVAPTILNYMDIAIPKEMNEKGSLIIPEEK